MASEVDLGRFCSVGPRVVFGGGIHPTDTVSTSPLFYSPNGQCGLTLTADQPAEVERERITVGHDVWIGANAYVRDGVNVGIGAVIAAGAVVVSDVPPYAIVGGVPARVIRYRLPPDTVQGLLATRWWEWDLDRLRAERHRFVSKDVREFIRAAMPAPDPAGVEV